MIIMIIKGKGEPEKCKKEEKSKGETPTEEPLGNQKDISISPFKSQQSKKWMSNPLMNECAMYTGVIWGEP